MVSPGEQVLERSRGRFKLREQVLYRCTGRFRLREQVLYRCRGRFRLREQVLERCRGRFRLLGKLREVPGRFREVPRGSTTLQGPASAAARVTIRLTDRVAFRITLQVRPRNGQDDSPGETA